MAYPAPIRTHSLGESERHHVRQRRAGAAKMTEHHSSAGACSPPRTVRASQQKAF
jgi:hypothetical protein